MGRDRGKREYCVFEKDELFKVFFFRSGIENFRYEIWFLREIILGRRVFWIFFNNFEI